MIEVGIEGRAAWNGDAEPDVSFLPPLLRRRCSRLTRMMLHVAYGVGATDELSMLPAIFASRHGEIGATVTLLQALARGESLTAAAFSHSVHNAQVGLFSIAARNRSMASAVAAGGDTFGAAFLEATASMHRSGHERALLVVGDNVLPEVFTRFQEDPAPAYAVALLLGPAGVRVGFEPGGGEPAIPSARPHALEFIHWLEGTGETLRLGTRVPYTWRRLAQMVR